MDSIILDDFENQKEDKISLKKQNFRLLIFIGLMIGMNWVISNFIKPVSATHINGQLATSSEVKSSILITLLIGFPIIGFILGSIFSLIPYKGLTYGKKYLRTSLISILLLYVMMFLLYVRNIILY